MPGEENYLIAFWDLSTERQSNGSTLGQIPWSIARTYAREQLGYTDDMLGMFWRVISKMDSAFLGGKKDEYDRTVATQNSGSTTTGNRTTEARSYNR